jgi:hypothetical protein
MTAYRLSLELKIIRSGEFHYNYWEQQATLSTYITRNYKRRIMALIIPLD